MKKILAITIILSVISQFASAQWSTSGSNIYNSNTGNVGIGTTSPGSSLDIGGLIQLSGINSTTPPSGLSYGLFPFGGVGLGIFSGATSPGQGIGIWTNPNGVKTEVIRILSGGYLGIGTSVPAEVLTVGTEDGTNPNARKAIQVGSGGFSQPGAFNTSSNGDKLILYNSSAASYDARVGVGTYGNLWFKSLGLGNNGVIEWYTGSNVAPKMVLSANGALSIGTTNPYSYMLAVNGSAIATSVTIKANANWPDYVFKKDYRLPKLSDIKTYVEKNQRLPEMPSATEIEKDGLNLGEINMLLVKKVEELTLYLIELKKENEALARDQKYINIKLKRNKIK